MQKETKKDHKFDGHLPSVPGGRGIWGKKFPLTITNDATGGVQPKTILTMEGKGIIIGEFKVDTHSKLRTLPIQ